LAAQPQTKFLPDSAGGTISAEAQPWFRAVQPQLN